MTNALSRDLLAGADAAAAYTGLTRRVIYHLVESGVLPVKRIGRRLYFRRSELDSVFRSAPSQRPSIRPFELPEDEHRDTPCGPLA